MEVDGHLRSSGVCKADVADGVTGREADSAIEHEGVLVTASIPLGEFALAETFRRVPLASVRCETTVECGESALPILWIRSASPAELEDALQGDPSVERATLLADNGDERMYRLSWSNNVDFSVDLLTAERATVLGRAADARGWTIRMLAPSRQALRDTVTLCRDYGLSIAVNTINHVGAGRSGQFGLTSAQYDSLSLACERGYYEIPRKAQLTDLADEMGVSHRAYSERLRRATEGLVERTILNRFAGSDGSARAAVRVGLV